MSLLLLHYCCCIALLFQPKEEGKMDLEQKHLRTEEGPHSRQIHLPLSRQLHSPSYCYFSSRGLAEAFIASHWHPSSGQSLKKCVIKCPPYAGHSAGNAHIHPQSQTLPWTLSADGHCANLIQASMGILNLSCGEEGNFVSCK